MIAAAGYINYAGDLDNIIKVKDKEKAAAVVTSEVGENSEADHVARDYQIPVIKGVQKATEVITEGKLITVDPLNGMIYQGAVRNRKL